ncbi:substrate-binding domain-containing protein [Sorangium sp. So ce1099]|uniref:substrate-binding domain-containing protein n=1 Tax=Sorangium sp. So ce1099 TaxID=3133331 RepID=UPI003F5F451B
MVTGLDLHATLHRIVMDAVGTVPSAQRGSLMARDGEQLVYKASVGLAGVLASPQEVAGGAGPATLIATLGAADSTRIVAAGDWYREHLPGASAAHLVPAGAVMVLTPVRVQGQTIGVLAVEQPDGQAPSGERWARLRALAASAGAALERRELYNDKAQSAQEVRVVEAVLNAVAARTSTHELVEIISKGIKSVQLRPQWRSVHLVLLSDAPSGGARGDAAAREIRIYHVPHRSPLAFWNNVRDGALIAGRSVGVHVDVRNAPAHSAAEQRGILEEGIDRGVHGIAVAPITPEVLEPAIRRAVEAGIPVVTIDTPPAEGSRAHAYVGTDNVAAGRLAAEMMARLLPGGGKVGALTFWLSAINSRERIEAFRAALSGAPFDLQTPAEDRCDIELGTRIAQEAMQNGGVAGAFGVCAVNGVSWGTAAKALGRAGELKIVAFDLLTDTLAMLREGTIHAALVQREHEMGYRAVQLLHDMMSKGAEAALAGLPTRAGSGGGPALRFIDTGLDVVTLERTPWSLPLSEYLALDANRKAAKRREQLPYESRAKELLLVTVDAGSEGYREERASLDARSMVGRVLSTARSVIVDTLDTHSSALHDAPDVVEARGKGAHTLVGVPLLAGGSAFGALVLESGRRAACSLDDLTLIERVADTMAVALENAQLVHRITERTHELEHANRHQASLLDTIRELSSPVVPIARNILVMPIVGTMDAQRSGRFIESMLRDITEHQARVVLVDVTGMAFVDAASVEHLLRAARAARLLGAEVVLVGITPAAARLMVEQGVDLGSVITRSTLELGFAHALSKTGGQIVYRRSA